MTASEDFSHDYLEYLSSLIDQLDRESISKFADLLLTSRDSGSTTFFLGNGGSASTATHFVNDVSLGSRQFDKPFRAISLCDNQAVITAIANDDGYENIFLQQLQTLAKAGDTIVCISASGNSKNLIKAIEYARENEYFYCWFDCLRWWVISSKIVILIFIFQRRLVSMVRLKTCTWWCVV